jgi:sugar (pentulose or hexulose) kinase
MMAAAMEVPVAVMETAGEGGAWGMALLAAYMKEQSQAGRLEDFLSENVFSHSKQTILTPNLQDVKGFQAFMDRYVKGLKIEKTAVEVMD